MSNEARPVNDHNIANLDYHAEKIVRQLQANEWKLLSTPDMEVSAMKELLQDQVELEKVIGWMSGIKNKLRPPSIVTPNRGSGGMQLVN